MDYSTLPMMLTPKEVQVVLGLPKDLVYRLFNSKDFPSIKVKGKHLIPRPRFLYWLGEKEVGS